MAAAIPQEQAAAAAFLATLAGAPPRETHISAVFVGRDTAWKMKKAVRFPYLDFTTLAARRHFLGRELTLNRRTAPGIYRDVVAIRRDAAGRLHLGGDRGEIIEFVLRMAAVAETDFFDRIAARQALTPALLCSLADGIADFHDRLPPVAGWDSAGAFAALIAENLTAATQAGLPAADLAALAEALRGVLLVLRETLTRRAAQGFVRRGHGDLHLGNVCLWEGRPTLFDALEFDERLATIDLGHDIGFLLMDLDQRVDRKAANLVFNRYLARRGDYELPLVLPLFLALRALIRAHVEAARGASEWGAQYLAAARRYLAPPGPGLVLAIGGLPGSGKSTLARGLAAGLGPAPGALVLRSDEIRKRLHGVSPETRLPPDAYDQASHDTVRRVLLAATAAAAPSHHAVIVDASFLDPSLRAEIAATAETLGIPFRGFWLQAPLPALAARIAARHDDASDATIAVLHRLAATAPALPPLAQGWQSIDASDIPRARAEIEARVGPYHMPLG